MKTGPGAHGTVENDSRRANHENWTPRPQYRLLEIIWSYAAKYYVNLKQLI
jgi:hypothetical protein